MVQHSNDLIGRTLGSCVLERVIAEGGMGTVYLARQMRPMRHVAIKVLQPHLVGHGLTYEEFLARFRREADVIARLEHMNIMPIYEYGEQDGLLYLVMPYLTGGSLRDLLARRGTLSVAESLTYLQQTAAALDYAHAHGIVHRDLKPANFLLHADGRLILADFGIARIMEDRSNGTTLTGVGALVGTPDYMAPEMVRGETIDQRADIYELGIVLFQMLSGRLPFSGNTTYAIILQHVQEPLPRLHDLNPAIPAKVDLVLQKATAKKREERYSSGQEMVQDLLLAASSPSAGYHGVQNSILPGISSSYSHSMPMLLQSLAPAPMPSGTTALSHHSPGSAGTTNTPRTLHEEPIAIPSHARRRWLIFVSLVLAIALLIGGMLVGLQFSSGPGPNKGPTPPDGNGPLLYQTANPGQRCDTNQGVWQDFDGIKITCQGSNVLLTNTARQGFLQGTFLTTLPGKAFPANYVVQAQLQQNTGPDTKFGLYFRNQPGQQLGVYTFLIDPPENSWGVYVYDDKTGAEKMLSSGSFNYLHTQVTLAVSVNGPQFTFYVNGKQLGSVTDSTYPTGNAGIAVDQGGTVTASNFALYATS